MIIHNSVDDFYKYHTTVRPVSNAVVTTGTFDGVHLGHQKVIARVKEIADAINGETVLLTFFPHPRMVLFPDHSGLQLLNTQDEKSELLRSFGVDHLIVHPFTKEFSRMSSVEFVRDILVNKINIKKLVIGYNHHFGRNREGSFENLMQCGKTYNFGVEEIPARDIDHIDVSSTKIRNALLEGDVDTALQYLGHSYCITGTVEEGKRLGRKIGYPTANLKVSDEYKLIPLDGVYAVKVRYNDEMYGGMLNIGYNPTVSGTHKTIEVHLFDFVKDIYTETLTLYFIKRLRGEIKFRGVEELKSQLYRDKEHCYSIFNQPETENEV